MFRAAGRKTYVAGNIGLPYAVVNQVKSDDVVVAELSSFSWKLHFPCGCGWQLS